MTFDVTILEPIVSVGWLNKNISASNLIVLDGTINKTFDASQVQIPNARFFDIKKRFSDVSNPFPSAFPSSEQFQKEARNLGINSNSAIVVYDDKGIYSSARVWWLFRSFGHDNVAVLNGGFPSWLKAGYPIETSKPFNDSEGDFVANYITKNMKFFQDLKSASKNRTHNIIDARSKARFNCEVPEPRVGLRKGTIPGSVNLPYTDLLENRELKSKEELEDVFSNVAEKEDDIIFSCGSGITACVLALGAEVSGFSNLSIYDGSWTEWGSLVAEE